MRDKLEKLLDAYKRRAAKDYAFPSEGFRNVRL